VALSSTARYWGVVAAFGALWGALEFTLGSFLHVIKIPFGGTMLAVTSAALLVAQRQLLPRRGLSLATGIVAAICKSVSPGGLILGPMVAITVEALLVELALLPAPRSRACAALAGALVVFWATFQKVISQYIYLGGTVIELYVALLERGAELVGLTSEGGWQALGALVGVLCLVGSAVALWGRGVGRQVAREVDGAAGATPAALAPPEREPERERERQTRKPQRRAVKLAALAVAIGCVALQFQGRIDLAVLSVAIWLLTLAVVDRRALNRLRMPKFWAIMIVFALGSGLLLGPRDLDVLGVRLSAEGLEAGVLMVLRGVFLFGLTSWAARAVEMSPFRHAAQRVGLGNLAVAVGSAFGALPALIDRLRRSGAARGERASWVRRAVVDALAETARLADRLAPEFAGGPSAAPGGGRARLVVVEGAPGAGKTAAVAGLSTALRARGLVVGGVLQPALEGEGPGERPRAGYELLDLASGARHALALRRTGGARGFDFDDDAWAWAAERIARAQQECDVVVVDELGRLEAAGGGHIPGLAALAERPGRAAVLVGAVRAGCLASLSASLGEPALELRAPLDAEALEAAAGDVARVAFSARAE
jgi:hypothetical protein